MWTYLDAPKVIFFFKLTPFPYGSRSPSSRAATGLFCAQPASHPCLTFVSSSTRILGSSTTCHGRGSRRTTLIQQRGWRLSVGAELPVGQTPHVRLCLGPVNSWHCHP